MEWSRGRGGMIAKMMIACLIRLLRWREEDEKRDKIIFTKVWMEMEKTAFALARMARPAQTFATASLLGPL